jgi:AcrR family transcriptional regulator
MGDDQAATALAGSTPSTGTPSTGTPSTGTPSSGTPSTGTASTGTEARRRLTSARLTSAARRLTAEGGLSGFTIQELCDRVGVSRRTFFNYFPTKEDAVLGLGIGVDDAHVAAFMSARHPDAPLGVSDRLLDDLARLAIAHFDAVGLTREDAAEFTAALRREPGLLTTLVKLGQQQQRFIAMVAEREGVDGDRSMPEVAVAVLTALSHVSAEAFFSDSNSRPFDELLLDRLAVAKSLFATEHDLNRPRAKELVATS